MRNFAAPLTALGLLVCLTAQAGCSNVTSETLPKHATPSPTPSLTYIGQWGAKGSDPGQLSQPAGIATNSLGDVFLADPGSAFVTKFAYEGKPLLSFQEDGMNHPAAIALDRAGAIYVADPVRDSVFVFLPNGDRFRELHLRSRPNAENQLSVAVGDDGLIHILDPIAGKFLPTPFASACCKPGSRAKLFRVKAASAPSCTDPTTFCISARRRAGL